MLADDVATRRLVQVLCARLPHRHPTTQASRHGFGFLSPSLWPIVRENSVKVTLRNGTISSSARAVETCLPHLRAGFGRVENATLVLGAARGI